MDAAPLLVGSAAPGLGADEHVAVVALVGHHRVVDATREGALAVLWVLGDVALHRCGRRREGDRGSVTAWKKYAAAQ